MNLAHATFILRLQGDSSFGEANEIGYGTSMHRVRTVIARILSHASAQFHVARLSLDLAAVFEVRFVVPLQVRHGCAAPAAAFRPQRHIQLLYLRHQEHVSSAAVSDAVSDRRGGGRCKWKSTSGRLRQSASHNSETISGQVLSYVMVHGTAEESWPDSAWPERRNIEIRHVTAKTP